MRYSKVLSIKPRLLSFNIAMYSTLKLSHRDVCWLEFRARGFRTEIGLFEYFGMSVLTPRCILNAENFFFSLLLSCNDWRNKNGI